MSDPSTAAPASSPAATSAATSATKPADATLRRHYDQQIRAWFGELRPLRLEGAGRFFTPPPALPLRAVFVPPALSPTYLQPTEAEPVLAGAADILQWFAQQQRLVVLGDPGSGKSTLVGWLAWRLCAGLTEPLPAWCEGVVPVPMILRDMQLAGLTGFDGLLAAHLRTELISGHPALRSDWGVELHQRLQAQPASLLFLIDGLDELPLAARQPVRDAIREGMARLPQARFMVTSRIVGYEQHAIEAAPEPGLFTGDLASATLGQLAMRNAGPELRRLYVMPFDAGRIRQFARNWFEHGESGGRSGEGYLQKFVEGLMRDPVARQLARTPNLLVMAAQVFGITNTLPDGRAKLYEAITKAYLESIDQRYGLVDPRYSLEQKKTWLAAVGYQLQLRRGPQAGEPAGKPARDLLVAEAEVVDWLSAAMAESGLEPDERYVRSFVDAIARRSGLFIPRGEGLYAFSHLSIQEYFAALHLRSAVLDFAVSDPQRLAQQFDELQRLADEPAWRETLITFFELPDWSPRVIGRLWQAVFGAELALVPVAASRGTNGWEAPDNAARVELLARLVVNPGITLPAPLRQQGHARAMAYARSERAGEPWWQVSGVLGALTANDEGCQRLWAQLRQDCAALSGSDERLDLRGARISDFSPLAAFSPIKALNLRNTAIADLSVLAGLTALQNLWIDHTAVSSLTPLAGLVQIETLSLSFAAVSDLSALRGLRQLESLDLSYTPVNDLDALRGLENLTFLSLMRLDIHKLEPLAELHKLLWLDLDETKVSDLRPLAGLTKLRRLHLRGTPVTDTSPLAGLADLTIHHGPDGHEAKPRQP